MRTQPWRDIRVAVRPEAEQAENVARLRDRCLRHDSTLASLRKARQTTQVELARVLGMEQPQISQIENRTDLYLSTLERYVAALGGRLELCAVFDDERFPIRIGELADEEEEQAASAESSGLLTAVG